jgi:hypothetical protein
MGHVILKNLLFGELNWRRFWLSLLLIYTFFALYVYFRADSMIFMPQPATYRDSEEILKIPVNDAENISAVYLPNSRATFTILYIHGNAEDLGDIRPVLERLHRWGFSVFAYDYRGYGTSDGNPGETNAYQDAGAAFKYLNKELGIPSEKIIPYGRSVGGGSATELAASHSVGGLILESTFTSAFRVAVPFPLLPFDKFPNLDRIRNVRCPVIVLHGGNDMIIPIQHGKTLFAKAPEPKMSLWIAEAGHNDFTWEAGDEHQKALSEFQELVKAHQQKRTSSAAE